MGSSEYVDAQRRLVGSGRDGFWPTSAASATPTSTSGRPQMQLKPMRVGRVQLYTDGLDEAALGLTGVERVTDLDRRVADSMAGTATRAWPSCRRGPTSCRYTRRHDV